MTNPHLVDWSDLSRLLRGTPRQRSAAETLLDAGIPDLLDGYSPILCGTVPIDCDLPSSDLDVVCFAAELDLFWKHAESSFNALPNYFLNRKQLRGVESVICRFMLGVWPVEIVAQPLAVQYQYAYGHMLAEALLLHGATAGTNDIIRSLKQKGLSTEEAFASHFGLPGDPYEALFRLYEVQFSTHTD